MQGRLVNASLLHDYGFSTLEVRASRASRRMVSRLGQQQRFSTLEVRASRASPWETSLQYPQLEFQYPRSSGQSCKTKKNRVPFFSVLSFSTLEVRASRASRPEHRPVPARPSVSVPSKFGPVVQATLHFHIEEEILGFSTLEVRASRASGRVPGTLTQIQMFQYPRSSGQSCKEFTRDGIGHDGHVSVPSKFGPIVQER